MSIVNSLSNSYKEEILTSLSNIIIQNLKEEFSRKKLSGNLINTIEVEISSDEVKIHIPAKTYNMLLFQTKGVVVHTNNGSYASKLDEEGSSFMVYPQGTRKGSHRVNPRNHIGFIDRVINKSIREWRSTLSEKNVKYINMEG